MKIRENWKRIISLFLVIVIMSGSMLFPTKVMATDIVLPSPPDMGIFRQGSSP